MKIDLQAISFIVLVMCRANFQKNERFIVHRVVEGRGVSQFGNYYFAEVCSGSEAGSYSRLIDFVYNSTPGLRVMKKKKKPQRRGIGSIREVEVGTLNPEA